MIPDLFTEQCIAHIKALLQFGDQTTDIMETMIRASTKAFHLKAGIAGGLFEMPQELEPVIMDLWIKFCWIHLAN